jgi:hypothetical protein
MEVSRSRPIGHGCYNGKMSKEIPRVSCACIERALSGTSSCVHVMRGGIPECTESSRST